MALDDEADVDEDVDVLALRVTEGAEPAEPVLEQLSDLLFFVEEEDDVDVE